MLSCFRCFLLSLDVDAMSVESRRKQRIMYAHATRAVRGAGEVSLSLVDPGFDDKKCVSLVALGETVCRCSQDSSGRDKEARKQF
ncbi:hypothetical protein M438DRAFT_197522 [Aureobasidium pullulans EXF-150]|uniref:Uncharacterized protein n=1 Tax=Aureobasidium pullulans EXF-150 TaxID=1043002 RepID=A0A074XJ36_AURPU|nr:uncharacterized protein M438DRAFT_197522 [Aureobasidium pullulans EXF-150]KEQ85540.1 hypothetical protein M438DRAFT_197522 [Aureobasidium pullulans EXF-150]